MTVLLTFTQQSNGVDRYVRRASTQRSSAVLQRLASAERDNDAASGERSNFDASNASTSGNKRARTTTDDADVAADDADLEALRTQTFEVPSCAYECTELIVSDGDALQLWRAQRVDDGEELDLPHSPDALASFASVIVLCFVCFLCSVAAGESSANVCHTATTTATVRSTNHSSRRCTLVVAFP